MVPYITSLRFRRKAGTSRSSTWQLGGADAWRRYIAWPAQALSYKMKQKILELRARAQKEVGAKFDLRAFRDAVLDSGPLPLDVLEGKIDGWIKERK
ncbi:MAG TPA: DUF885 family protein [Candidatus Sulfotelmatobacter sp.]|nr:DUF885 family protein [Candidatus Sulfotelmatobacter sp.]